MNAASLCLGGAGAFFLVGLSTGVWKYLAIARAPDGRAPAYVDVAHRTALLYAFACGLLAQLCRGSAWPNPVNLGAAWVMMVFFAATVASYVLHGLMRDTDNQLRRPHRFGTRTIAPGLMVAFMATLIVAEIGGFAVIFSGYLAAP